MKKILWIGDGVTPTGFATVNHNIIKHLPKEKYEVHHLAVNYWGDPHPYDHYIYPASSPKLMMQNDVMGYGRIGEFKNKDIDIIFILNDIWVIEKYLDVIKHIWAKNDVPKIIVYYPVDGEGYSPQWFQHFDIVTEAVVYTEFGKTVTQEVMPDLELNIIPHGATDRDFFFKTNNNIVEIKKKAYPQRPDLWNDSFIVLNANRNQPRKVIDSALEGFAIFAKGKPDNVMYYHHAGIKDAGWHIVDLVHRLQREYDMVLEKRLILTNAEVRTQKVSMEKLNQIYNSTDIGLNTSLGEGWGLTQTEQAALGKPQIVGNHTACAELFHDIGLLVPVAHTVKDIHTLLKRHYVSPKDVAISLEKLYQDKELRQTLGQNSEEKFSQPYYNWNEIGKVWAELFDKVVG